MTGISDVLFQRMVEVIRAYATADGGHVASMSVWFEFQAIAAELPKPVDPDLVEARKLVCARSTAGEAGSGYRRTVMSGSEDDSRAVVNALEAIKHGRKLQAEGR